MTVSIEELLKVANGISLGEIVEYQHDECFTSGAFDDLLADCDGAQAYYLLSKLCEKFELVRNLESGMKGYYILLSQLACRANTTEMPAGMLSIIQAAPELSEDLQAWYRYKI